MARLPKAAVAAAVIACAAACSSAAHEGTGPAGSSSTSSATVATTPSHPAPPTTRRSAAPTTTTAPACNAEQVIETWPLRVRAAQLLIVPIQEDDVAAAAPMVADGAGGIILFGSSAPESLGAGLEEIERSAHAGLKPLVMTDEEGGEIERMANLVGDLPWPRTMAETLTPQEVRAETKAVAVKMRAAGVTMDLAPVVDLSDSPGPDDRYPDGPRSFGLDPTTATTYGLAFAQGLQAGGVIPVVKHFPGLGQATGNTDDESAILPSLATLAKTDLKPFEAAIAARLPAIMVSNATVTGLTGSTPAGLSKAAVTGVLRDQLHFTGLVVTDGLDAKAISNAGYSVSEATVAAIAAGADMIMWSNTTDPITTFDNTVDAIVNATNNGTIPEAELNQAVEQVLQAKNVDPCHATGP